MNKIPKLISLFICLACLLQQSCSHKPSKSFKAQEFIDLEDYHHDIFESNDKLIKLIIVCVNSEKQQHKEISLQMENSETKIDYEFCPIKNGKLNKYISMAFSRLIVAKLNNDKLMEIVNKVGSERVKQMASMALMSFIREAIRTATAAEAIKLAKDQELRWKNSPNHNINHVAIEMKRENISSRLLKLAKRYQYLFGGTIKMSEIEQMSLLVVDAIFQEDNLINLIEISNPNKLS